MKNILFDYSLGVYFKIYLQWFSATTLLNNVEILLNNLKRFKVSLSYPKAI